MIVAHAGEVLTWRLCSATHIVLLQTCSVQRPPLTGTIQKKSIHADGVSFQIFFLFLFGFKLKV